MTQAPSKEHPVYTYAMLDISCIDCITSNSGGCLADASLSCCHWSASTLVLTATNPSEVITEDASYRRIVHLQVSNRHCAVNRKLASYTERAASGELHRGLGLCLRLVQPMIPSGSGSRFWSIQHWTPLDRHVQFHVAVQGCLSQSPFTLGVLANPCPLSRCCSWVSLMAQDGEHSELAFDRKVPVEVTQDTSLERANTHNVREYCTWSSSLS